MNRLHGQFNGGAIIVRHPAGKLQEAFRNVGLLTHHRLNRLELGMTGRVAETDDIALGLPGAEGEIDPGPEPNLSGQGVGNQVVEFLVYGNINYDFGDHGWKI